MKNIVILGIAAVMLAGCSPSFITGTVVDFRGEAVPGVAVTTEGKEFQAITDALGHYRIRYAPGTVVLNFLKTSYTPGALELEVDALRPIEATTVSLWALPLEKGVYLFEDYTYRPLTRVQPDRYFTHDRRPIHGTTRWPETRTAYTAPVILCYKMPSYDVRFCRIDSTELTKVRPRGREEQVEVLTNVRTIPAALEAIDQPDGLLRQLRLPGSLEPGSYAIHWGALDGRTSLDPRAFTFDVTEIITIPEKTEAKEGEPKAEKSEKSGDGAASAPS
jgi:carboxypeptidase family protein